MTHSAIYEGVVYHRRTEPRPHEFRYRLFMLYLDLDELPRLLGGLDPLSLLRRVVAWFRRADYLGNREVPLKEAVLARVEQGIGRRPQGAVRMLTHVRTLGYVFNPVTFYYCFDHNDQLEAVAAEITNTPWGERHTYVLDSRDGGDASRMSWRFPKEFHVSPFFGMDLHYEWGFAAPTERLDVAMANLADGRPVFHAGLSCERRPFTASALASALVRHPFLTARMHLAIYWQAARLWAKRMPFYDHPTKSTTAPTTHTT